MWIVQYVPNSNSSKILWLSSLPTSLISIWSKMILLSSGQHFPKTRRPSRMDNSHADSQNCTKTILVRDFMPILVISMSGEDPIKIKSLCLSSIFPIKCVWETKEQVTLIWVIWSVQYFIAVLVNCKSDEDLIKNEIAIVRTAFFYEVLKDR